MATYDKLFSLALSACMFTGIAPSAAPAAVIYFNGFESGEPIGTAGDTTENGYCRSGSEGGTSLFVDYKGCVSIVPTSSINAGSGSFVGWADPDQSYEGDTVPGSTFHLVPYVPLVDGWQGVYELSFKGSGITELVFIDGIWGAGFDIEGLEELKEGSEYKYEINFDERIEVYGSIDADPASLYLCSYAFSESGECVFSNWHFAIQSGGWIDDIELNYLGTGQGSTTVPEPGTLGLILTGLIAAGTLKFRKAGT
jgi:hypothetical protein